VLQRLPVNKRGHGHPNQSNPIHYVPWKTWPDPNQPVPTQSNLIQINPLMDPIHIQLCEVHTTDNFVPPLKFHWKFPGLLCIQKKCAKKGLSACTLYVHIVVSVMQSRVAMTSF